MKNGYVPLIRLLTVRLLDKSPNGVAVDPRTVAVRATAALKARCYGMGSHVSDNDPEASTLMPMFSACKAVVTTLAGVVLFAVIVHRKHSYCTLTVNLLVFQVLEKAKKRHLEGKSKSRFPNEAPGWEEELATDSEAVVKAERASGDIDVRELQRSSINYLKEESESENQDKDQKPGS